MNKPFLRNALKKLRAIPFDESEHANVMMAPQEMLDFLAMIEGIKPVYLLGRGFDDPQWIEGVIALAKNMGLHVAEGTMWSAKPVSEDLPEWFRDEVTEAGPDGTAFYISRTRAAADAVQAAIDNPPITMEEEARLLGYPVCCVRAHYERDALFDRAFYMLVERTGGGDIAEMQRILREDVEMAPETDEEKAMVKAATEFTPAPFTSFHVCDECASDPSRPAGQLSRRYEEFARAIDGGLADMIAANQRGIGRYD